MQDDLIIQKQINQEIKDIFVYKDFQLNGLTTSKIKSSIKSTYPDPKDLDGTSDHYAVQIGAYAKKMKESHFKMIKQLNSDQLKNGTFIYLSGRFTSVKEATKHQKEMRNIGYKHAFIVKVEK